IMQAVQAVLESQHFIMGPEVSRFERAIVDLIGCKFAISCASGSDALLLALMALGIGPGDEVVTTPFTFVATAGSICRLKAIPVFTDIDRKTYNLDWRQLESAVTKRTKAIIPVHLFGLCADMERINAVGKSTGVPVIEDAAQAIGSRYNDAYAGNMGAFGCFSFFPSKNLGGAGDGGMVTTNNPEMASRLAMLRLHGSRSKYEYQLLGMNSRLDTLQAAILLVKIKYLKEMTEARQRNAECYRLLFSDADSQHIISLPEIGDGLTHVYNQFVIRVPLRDQLRQHLRDSGIPTEIYYHSPLHL